MNPLELKVNRANTKAFIDAKPSDLVLIPQEKEPTKSGGFKLVPTTPRASQTMRIIELGTNQSPPVLVLSDGKQREAEFWLLALHDAEVAINDYWVAEDGREWLVGDLVRSNAYEVRGLVTERGR
jgi:hypothetical protein